MRRAARILIAPIFAAALAAGCVQHLAELDMSDPGIRARVQTELKTHPELETSLLQVNVHVRIVYLSGIVPNYRMKRRIGETVRRVPGVQQVVNNLVVTD